MTKQLLSVLVLTVIVNGLFAQSLQRQRFGTGENAFTMEFVEIGNPGNPADSGGNPSQCGNVNYVYSIAKYEVSRDMVNKANADGGLGIGMRDMTKIGGNGSNKPAVGICWNEAARFVNWLNSKEGFPPAYKFEKAPREEGYSAEDNIILWAPSDKGYDESNKYRNKLAKYFIPTNDEWYKAAFYDPEKKEYSVYAVKSDGQSPLVVEEAKNFGKKDVHHSGLEPRPISSGKEFDGEVYGQPDEKGPADVDNAGGLSHYGTMAQGGNVCEWLETAQDGTNDDPKELRQPRGGSWDVAVKFAGSLGSKVMYYNFVPYACNEWPGGIRVVAKNPNASEVVNVKNMTGKPVVMRRKVIPIPFSRQQQDQPKDIEPIGVEESYQGHSYKFIPTKKSWDNANKDSKDKGGYLVSIGDASENDFVIALIQKASAKRNDKNPRVWIGLNNDNDKSEWKWESGESYKYTNWCSNDPNNWMGWESSGCMNPDPNRIGQWFDISSDLKTYYIIEKENPKS